MNRPTHRATRTDGVASSPQSTGVRSLVSRAVAATPPGRVVVGTAKATGAAARVAAGATVNLPVAGPRTAARAVAATTDRAASVRARLGETSDRARTWGRQWAEGVAHPARAFRAELDRARGGTNEGGGERSQ